jgi:hypothetical protein
MLLTLAWLTTTSPASAAALDLSKIERTLRKEPAYQSKSPRYGLLVFGPKAEQRVWLVLDHDALYVDVNGNGDLTEAGKRVKVKTPNQDPASFEEIELPGPDGKKEKLRFALYGWFNHKKGKDEGVEPSVTVSWRGRWYGAWGDGDSALRFAARPHDAPILHIGGPLEMGFESRLEHAFRKSGDRQFDLAVGVGTPGLGKGTFTHLTYWDDAIPKNAQPTAELEFPNPRAGGPPIKVKQVLRERC